MLVGDLLSGGVFVDSDAQRRLKILYHFLWFCFVFHAYHSYKVQITLSVLFTTHFGEDFMWLK